MIVDPLPEGTVIGRYRIEHVLGAGGMGVVYAAVDELLHRRVALKVLPPSLLSDDRSKQRLLREARSAAALDHPNLCTVFDAGENERGIFVAMQLLEGETLAKRMAAERIEVSRCIEIAAEIASGLREAHARGIVHRDLKPGNVMLTPKGVRILDFGLAHTTSDDHEAITREGEITGTIPYMAPEQIRGQTVADSAIDVFSFGVLFYEMLAGRRPFTAPNSAALMHAILHDPVPSLPTISISLGRVEKLLARMLNRNPLTRPSSAEILDELNELIATVDFSTDVPTEVTSRPEMTSIESGPPVTRSGGERWGSDSVLVSKSIDPEARRLYLKGRHLWNKRTPPAVKESITFFQQAIDIDPLFPQAYIGLADSNMFLSYLDFVSPRIVVSRARAAANRALELDPFRSEGHATLGWIHVVYDRDWERAKESFLEALRLDESNAEAHHWFGLSLAIAGEIDTSRQHVARAFELDSLSSIMAVGLSMPEYFSGRFDKSTQICREVVESDPSFPPARFYLGRSLEVAGYLDQAIEVYREMVAMVDVEMEHLASLGSCLTLAGRHDEAEQIERRLTEARGRRYITPFYYALLASGRRDADRAIEALTEAADDHATRIAELHVDPRFEWLHENERFRELVANVGFSPLRSCRET